MNDNRKIRVFLDEDPVPFAEFSPPVKFVLDTTKIPDGKHQLRIVAQSTSGKEGIKTVSFEVRNGPSISVLGLHDGEVVTDQVPVTINSYGSERNDFFLIRGSETPKGIPAWVWATVISFVGFALFYFIMYWNPDQYKSFF
ncbi:hypothetical protein SAMN03080617_00627 [Algoriphagus alkaliphilus]|jgi:hypothetical protein|uniref:Cytochrome C n=1 Tax=Algoriphagus alkaliphilus TaxID=279824 RepID=A0A1G5VQI7_9BACT|nr:MULTISPECIES: cytochrome C [Algoriphagus]MDO8966093.1 cytochrome C [Algoriphagus sp.]MDP2043505.1 cytochrome C [Algoriphagus sp.]MDP3199230.1 cytochrome C [Algoriphagus sp.]MDP3472437.1 cytochrome C [Algoriphagus sp.]SDA47984.1 hypothetical protein SAMN03080617_00627 [Algoriphagus alkaliphilus]